MADADTLAANVAEITQELIEATIMQMPQKAPLMNLVTRRDIPKGKNSIEIPRANSTFNVQNPTEGDDLVVSSQFDLTSTTISPTLRAIKVRISERSQYFSQEDILELVSDEFSRAEAQDIDTDLSAEFLNFHTDNDVGATNTDLTVAVMRQGRRLLQAVTVANGGPAPQPLYAVLSPVALEDLMTNIGLTGAVSSTSPWVPAGLSQSLIQQYHAALPQIVGVGVFWDGYLTEDGSSDFICAMFAKKSLWLAISKNWQMRQFEESNFIGVILRAVADYNSGLGAYTHWGSQITADGV